MLVTLIVGGFCSLYYVLFSPLETYISSFKLPVMIQFYILVGLFLISGLLHDTSPLHADDTQFCRTIISITSRLSTLFNISLSSLLSKRSAVISLLNSSLRFSNSLSLNRRNTFLFC